MTDKELQRLRRTDLIEILYYLSRENDELREENTKLREKLDAMLPGAAVGPSQGSADSPEVQPQKRKHQKKGK